MTEGKGYLRHVAWVVFFLLLFAGTAFGQACDCSPANLITEFTGFTWEETPGGPYQPGQDGNLLYMVATLDALYMPLVYDKTMYEYTAYVALTQNGDSQLTGSGSDFGGDWVEYTTYFHDGGAFETYEDAGMNSVYTPSPPNADVPSKFRDGTAYLLGSMSYTVSVLKVYTTGSKAGDESGNFSSCLNFNSGSQLGNLGGDTNGYTFGGEVRNDFAGIPAGYRHSIVGKAFNCPVNVEQSSWGMIKSKYQRGD
jgi:hypothetical protein